MFRSEHQSQGQPQIPTHSWYPSSVLTPSRHSPVTTTSMQSHSGLYANSNLSRDDPGPFAPSSAIIPPNTALASTFPSLREKSQNELRRLLTDKEAYNEFLHSLEQVKTLDLLQNDLKKSNLELAKQNLERESQIAELRNQCAVIRTSELASAWENFEKAQKHERELSTKLSKATLLDKLREKADEVDTESEKLHLNFVAGEVDLMEFLAKYRKLRVLYHRRLLTRLAAVTS